MLKKEEAALAELVRKSRQGELELSSMQSKITELQDALYGGKVTNSRELETLERKMQQSSKKREETEEALLEVMQQTELSEEKTKRLRVKAAKMARRYQQLASGLKTEVSNAAIVSEKLEAERNLLAATINPQWLSRYERLWKQRQSDVLAPVQEKTCGACRVSLPGSLVSLAASGKEVVHCESCGRILFVEAL